MTYWKIYNFKLYFSLALSFLILCLFALVGGTIWIILDGDKLWLLAAVAIFLLYVVYSALYLYNILIRRFKDEVKDQGEIRIIPIQYEVNTSNAYVKIGAKTVPLLGLYGKKIYKKYPEGTKIAAYCCKNEPAAILVKQEVK